MACSSSSSVRSMKPVLSTKGDSDSQSHVVKKGETLKSISTQYGCTPTALQNANPQLKACEGALPAGSELQIPRVDSSSSGTASVPVVADRAEQRATLSKAEICANRGRAAAQDVARKEQLMTMWGQNPNPTGDLPLSQAIGAATVSQPPYGFSPYADLSTNQAIGLPDVAHTGQTPTGPAPQSPTQVTPAAQSPAQAAPAQDVPAQNMSTQQTPASTTPHGVGSVDPLSQLPSGQGGAWLAQFLYDKGLRGDTLAKFWAIGMRESGGRPGIDNEGLNSNGSIDYGLFQINSVHANWIRERFGYSMDDLRDPNKNFEVMWHMSKQGQNFSAWALPNADGSLTGWAANLSPQLQQRYEKIFNEKLAEFPRYAAQAGLPGFENGNA